MINLKIKMSISKGLRLFAYTFLLAFAFKAQATNCARLSEILAEHLRFEGYTDNPVETIFVTQPTVRISSATEGAHGGNRLLVKKMGISWGSIATSTGFDPQGDPRWFIESVGPEAAEFFGFKIIDDSTIQIPDEREFSLAISKINTHFAAQNKEPIPISFYSAVSTRDALTRYLKHFYERLALPIADSEHHLIHDISFHSAAIFLPKSLLEYSRERIRYLEGFLEFMKLKHHKKPAQFQEARKYYARVLRMQMTYDIDVGTANVASSLLVYLHQKKRVKPEDDPVSPIYSNIVLGLLGINSSGETPFSATFATFQKGLSEPPFKDTLKITAQGYSQIYTQEQVLLDLREYSEKFRSQLPHFEPHLPFTLPLATSEELCVHINQRRLEIREAALALLKSK